MKYRRQFFLLTGAVVLLTACATVGPVKSGKERYWPLPPDPPVISYLTSFSEPKDMGPQRNWFSRVIKFLFGEGETPYMLRPYAVAANGNGRIYVTDTGVQAVHVYDFPSKSYHQIFWIERGRSRLMSPVGIALDEKEMIYVSDSQLNRIFVYEPQKRKLIRTLGKAGQFQRLAGIAYDPRLHRLYAVDATAHQVTVLETDGTTVKTFGHRGIQEGELNFPTHVSIDSEGLVYITDSMNFRVQIFDSEGRWQGTLGRLGTTLGTFSKPKGVAVDSEGHIYVVDGIYDTIQIFNRKGDLLMNFGQTGEKEGDFWLPAGIAIDHKNRIYVADTYNKRVQIFQFMGTPKEETPAVSIPPAEVLKPIEH
jgi:DNA-binding beta-propeller fold protein YncE